VSAIPIYRETLTVETALGRNLVNRGRQTIRRELPVPLPPPKAKLSRPIRRCAIAHLNPPSGLRESSTIGAV
jgi:hypothetical protein